jgi:hypothetical protein
MLHFMRRVILLSIAFISLQLQAHPGHLPLEHGFAHALLSPYHFLSLLAAGAVLLTVGTILRRRGLKSAGAVALAIGTTGYLLTP